MQRIPCGLVGLLVLAVGCASQGRPQVQGIVTVNGKPVGYKTLVLFAQRENGEFFAQPFFLKRDGTFSGEVPEPGKYRVVVEESRAAQEGNQAPQTESPAIPAKYRDRTTSDVVWDIEPGNNTRNLNLTE